MPPRSAASSARLLARRGRGPNFCADSTLKRQPQGMAAPAGPRAQRFRQAVLHAVREQCVVQLLLFISATSGEWRGGGTAPHGSSSPHSASLAAKLGTGPPQGPSWATRPPGAAPRPGRCHAAPILRSLQDRRCKSRIGAAIRQHRSFKRPDSPYPLSREQFAHKNLKRTATAGGGDGFVRLGLTTLIARHLPAAP